MMAHSNAVNIASTSLTQLDPHFVVAAFQAVGAEMTRGYQCVPATALASTYYPQLESALPTLITGLATPELLQGTALALRNAYPSAAELTLVWPMAGEEVAQHRLTLAELATYPPADQLCLYLPPVEQYGNFSALQEIVAHLRSPEGCPWDRAQTLASLRHDLLSECAEVLEAIDAEVDGHDNGANIAEELGDLLLSIVLMVQIASEAGRFYMSDVARAIVVKLRRRHPHVFGNLAVDGVDQIVTNWDAIKAQEKAAKGLPVAHPLDGVPAALPALEKARQLQSKASKAGLLDRGAVAQQNPQLAALFSEGVTEATLGEFLWQVVAQAHQADLNAEDALRQYVVNYRAAHGSV
jgi:tetrapyrrole methylase family protein/MazG family protein